MLLKSTKLAKRALPSFLEIKWLVFAWCNCLSNNYYFHDNTSLSRVAKNSSKTIFRVP
jgi:hypothetical protein